MSRVTFKQLQAFVMLAHEQNFGRTAERLHVTPPTVTASIKSLEAAVGIRLFDRSTRSVALTPHAEYFLPTAERLLLDLQRALDDLGALSARRKGSVVACGATSFIGSVLAPAVAELATTYPEIRVELVQAPTVGIVRQVSEGNADFGVTSLRENPAGLIRILLLQDHFGVICHKDHPLAAKRSAIAFEEVARYPVIGLNRTNGLQAVIETTAQIPQAIRLPSHEVSNVSLMAHFLERNVGVALLPALAARNLRHAPVVVRPLKTPISRRLYLVMRRGRSLSPAATSLIHLMFQHLMLLRGDPMLTLAETEEALRAKLE